MPSAKRHTTETGHHFYFIYTRSLATNAPGYLDCHTVGAIAPARSTAYLAWLRVTCQHARLMSAALSACH